MRLSVKALKKQYKLYPDVRFKDDDATEVSLLDVANQLEAISGLMYPDAKEFAVQIRFFLCIFEKNIKFCME